jgi:hypothetical protein
MLSVRSTRALGAMRSHAAHAALTVVTLAALAACGGTSEPSVPPKDVVPATIVATSTDTLRGVVAGPVNSTLTVTVKNKAGEPIDSATVTFAVATGGGSIAPTNARTNSSGQATAAWTLGPSTGIQTVTATVGSLTPVVFTAVATAGAAAHLTILAGGTAQTATVGTNVPIAPSVKVTDAPGNPVAGAVVTFTPTAGGGVVTPTQVTTGADGVAAVTSWKLGTVVGPNNLVAATAGFSVNFTATATVGAAATLTLSPTGPVQLNTGGTVTLTARVIDAAGNVLTNPAVTFTSSNANVAAVTAAGVITATGAGTATITAASGTASATFAVTVIGHPAANGISKTILLGTTPGDVAFTKDATLIAASGLQKVVILDPEVVNDNGPVVTLTSGASILVAGRRTSGPALGVNVGVTSRIWFIDPTTAAVTDSADIQEIVNSAVIKSDGTRAYFLLSSGEVQPVDVTSHAILPRIALGGTPTKMRLDQGDTLAYVLTTVGIMFEIDTRTNTVTRQINLGTNGAIAPDFAISGDGKSLYLLDSFNSVVRIIDLATNTVQRIFGIETGAITIVLSPDGQQVWLTHATQISTYVGSAANGFLAGPKIQLTSLPIRIFFSPTGSFAAITNIGGWVDIVR